MTGIDNLTGVLMGILEAPKDNFTMWMVDNFKSFFQNLYNSGQWTNEVRQTLIGEGWSTSQIREGIAQLKETKEQFIKNIEGAPTEQKNLVEMILDLNIKVHEEIIRYGLNPIIPCEIYIEDQSMLPVYAHATDSGVDIHASESMEIEIGETKMVPTGIYTNVPHGYEFQIRPRSGNSAKTKMRVANAPGTIDEGYKGEWKIIIDNISTTENLKINKGDKIAQAVLAPVYRAAFTFVDKNKIGKSDRGENGFGSTGSNVEVKPMPE